MRHIYLLQFFLILFCHFYYLSAEQALNVEERFIGWKGETVRKAIKKESSEKPWIETISWYPRAFIYHKFLTNDECDHLISLAKGRLQRSRVVSKDGFGLMDPVRTSYSTRVFPQETEIVGNISKRVALWTHLPEAQAEPYEVLKYIDGQKYDAHWDWFDKDTLQGSNRIATVLMYLSDVDSWNGAGGETALPLAEPLDPAKQSIVGLSACANRSGLAVVPHKGDVLLFWDAYPDTTKSDRHSLHASCPTFKGEKWTATRWIHAG